MRIISFKQLNALFLIGIGVATADWLNPGVTNAIAGRPQVPQVPKPEQLPPSSYDLDDVSPSPAPADGSAHEGFEVMTVEFARVETPFMIGLWIFCSSIAKIGFHMAPKLNQIFPESCLLIFVGVLIGLFLICTSTVHVSPMTPDVFFLYMLPPIILDAGYFMPNRLFFDHLGTILMFAVVGTIFNTLTIGLSLWGIGLTGLFGVDTPVLDMLLFSALISAVDPVAVLAVFEEIHVNEILYIVVFGESLLNDAVTVVLYHMFEVYTAMGPSKILYTDVAAGIMSFFVVAIGGTLIGVIWGFLTGLVTRFTDQVRVIEPLFIFIMAYLAYLNAEIFHMSGILAITFCGITMKNYVEANISHKSHTTVKYAMKMLSSSSETIIFMFLGVSTVSDHHDWNTWFVVLTILFCSIYRAIGVIILTAIVNKFRLYKLSKVDKFVMSYGGLRGAVAFALVLLINPKTVKLQPMFVTTTIAVIYFTVFFQGITIKPMVKILKVKKSAKRKPTMNERIHEKIMDHAMTGIEDLIGHHGNHHLRDKFKRFDNRFIRPYILRNYQGDEPKILETYSKLAMRDAIDYMRRNASTIGNISGTESMSAIFRNYTAGNLSGSYSQLDTSTWNIDLQELEYNPSKKDLTDAKIHHLLAEELVQPYRRHRRLSYSRHAVDDRDLSTQVNYKMHLNIRRLVGQNRHHHKRSKRLKDGKNHVSFPGLQNGSAKQFTHDYLDEVLHEDDNEGSEKESKKIRDDWESGITFTAHPSPDDDDDDDSSQHEGSRLLAKLGTGRRATLFKMAGSASRPQSGEYVDQPTVAETSLPWRRREAMHEKMKRQSSRPVGWWFWRSNENGPAGSPQKKMSKDSDASEDGRVATPTATETMLPWKRNDESEMMSGALKQSEFPAWCSNKEYLAYNSPSATFLGLFRKGSSDASASGLAAAGPSSMGASIDMGDSCSLSPNDDEDNSTVLLIEEGTSSLRSSDGGLPRPPNDGGGSVVGGAGGGCRAIGGSSGGGRREDDYLDGDGSTPSLGDTRWSPRDSAEFAASGGEGGSGGGGVIPRRQASLPVNTSLESFSSSTSDGSPKLQQRP